MKRFSFLLTMFIVIFALTDQGIALSGFPSGHPAGAVSGTFTRYTEEYRLYIWKENNEIWIEFMPLTEEAFICGASFGIVQDDIWYDTVLLETPAKSSFCDDIKAPYVTKLTQYSFFDEVADLNRPFRFAHEDGVDIQSIYFNPNNNTQKPPTTIYTYFSPYFKSDGWTGLAISNLTAERIDTTAFIYANDGAILATETRAIDPNGQTHFVAGTNVAEDGWVKIVATNKIAGMCLAGTIGTDNYMADIPITDTLSKALVIPHVAYGPVFDTIILVSNPNDAAANVLITYVAMNGIQPYGSRTIAIPSNGCAQIPLSDLTLNEMINGGRVNISSNQGITAFAIYDNLKSGGRSFAGLNAFSTE